MPINPTLALRALLCILLSGLLLTGCAEGTSETQIGSDTPSSLLRNVTPEPNVGPPGTLILLSGLADLSSQDPDAEWTLQIGANNAPLLKQADGKYATSIPVNLKDGEDWPTAPDTPQDIVLLKNGAALEVLPESITIESLAPALNAGEQIGPALISAMSSLQAISNEVHSTPGEADQYAQAALDSIEDVITGSSEYSLINAIDRMRSDPETVELVDAVLASSGIIEQINTMAADFETLMLELNATANRTQLRNATPSELSDWELARKMQAYVVLEQFGREVINRTAVQFSIVLSDIGLDDIPGMYYGEVAALSMAILDFMVNKILLGTYPATITNIEFSAIPPTLKAGEKSFAQVRFTASNNPPPIGVNDIAGTVLTVLGVAATNSQTDALNEELARVLGNFQSAFSLYASDNPDQLLDQTVGTLMPEMQWAASITDDRLLDHISLTPEIVTSTENELSWTALPNVQGQGRVYVQPAVDSSVWLIPSYSGGAFGIEVPRSETVSLFVNQELILQASMPATINEGGMASVLVKAGHSNSEGGIDWKAGIAVEVSVLGGSASVTSGTTDENGELVSVITEGVEGIEVESVSVTVTVTDEYGNSQTELLTSSVQRLNNNQVVVEYVHLEGQAVSAHDYRKGPDGYGCENVGIDISSPFFDEYLNGTTSFNTSLHSSYSSAMDGSSASLSLSGSFGAGNADDSYSLNFNMIGNNISGDWTDHNEWPCGSPINEYYSTGGWSLEIMLHVKEGSYILSVNNDVTMTRTYNYTLREPYLSYPNNGYLDPIRSEINTRIASYSEQDAAQMHEWWGLDFNGAGTEKICYVRDPVWGGPDWPGPGTIAWNTSDFSDIQQGTSTVALAKGCHIIRFYGSHSIRGYDEQLDFSGIFQAELTPN